MGLNPTELIADFTMTYVVSGWAKLNQNVLICVTPNQNIMFEWERLALIALWEFAE